MPCGKDLRLSENRCLRPSGRVVQGSAATAVACVRAGALAEQEFGHGDVATDDLSRFEAVSGDERR